ncbi:universal stress protein [Rufibacter psychrotolerans]|uniref:universal stress protein n=1 Tax=Rufibacter psychrotolerans TaxID=2812556 RepID=UPI0019681B1F|nr:universal stress protein [Rufibacter sp. SYSU D00308]
MKTIAILTDFSPEAHNAIHYAVELCRGFNARLVFVHTFYFATEAPGTTTTVADLTWADPSLYTPGQLEAEHDRERLMKENLWTLVEDVRRSAPGLDIQGELLRGVGMDTVIDFLKAQAIDLVVMGTKGADSALDRWVGTNTSYVMNHAACPVLAVPRHSQFKGFSRLVYATDPYHEADWHLRELQALATFLRAEVTVLYVQEDPDSQQSQDRWQVFTSKWELEVPALTFARVINPKTAAGIEEYAQAKQADLLVVAKQNRSFLDSLFGSGPAERLVLDSVLPVLSLPALDEERAAQGGFFSRLT